jgi:endonuclease/exonuclease/phosphatase (EEP) superfamily protein YafD
MGDLNATPFSPRFKNLLIDCGLRDSSLGFGITRTWHSEIPLLGLPIDHILVSRDLAVISREVGPKVGSDHRPVMVRVARKQSTD